MDLAETLKKQREAIVEAGGFRFTVRRPTALELTEARGPDFLRRALRWVVGWEGVTTLAMGLPGGDGHPVAFTPALAEEWLADRDDIAVALVNDAMERYEAHAAKIDAAKKK